MQTGMKYRWPSDHDRVRSDFQRLFGLPFGDYYDPLMSLLSNRFCIDILIFDEKIHSIHGDYEPRGLSLRELVKKHYGTDAMLLLEDLI